MSADKAGQVTTANTSPPKPRTANTTQNNQQLDMDTPEIEHKPERKDLSKKPSPEEGKKTVQEKLDSYYADKDLGWWIELARDFKNATKVPLPEETDIDL